MAATFIQSNHAISSNSGSIPCAFSSNNTAGNTLVVTVVLEEPFGGAGSFGISDSRGNTYHVITAPTELNNVLTLCAYVQNCAGGANTVTVTYNSGFSDRNCIVAIHEYSGIPASVALDSSGTATGTNVTSLSLTISTVSGSHLVSVSGTGTSFNYLYVLAFLVTGAPLDNLVFIFNCNGGSIGQIWTSSAISREGVSYNPSSGTRVGLATFDSPYTTPPVYPTIFVRM